jgi:integrase
MRYLHYMEDVLEFRDHLLRYGRSEGTANLYAFHMSHDDPFSRLTDQSLSPKYRHSIRAALLAWTDYTEDEDLHKEIKRMRLPPAIRQSEKQPLTKKQWHKLIATIPSANINELVKAHLHMMATRGFRCSDVLRITRAQAEHALDSDVLSFVAKGSRTLNFPVSDRWRPSLELFMDYEGWSNVGELISPNSSAPAEAAAQAARRGLTAVGEICGIDEITPHLLRHTYATHFYRQCKDPVALKDHMQWASIETAMNYVAESDRGELEKVADDLFT